MDKPSLFIGSSSEGLGPARAIRGLLEDSASIILWNEGFFKPNHSYLGQLVNSLSRFDFAVFVATPDDYTNSKTKEFLSPRDNVIFELGLFMGYLGRDRTFMVYQTHAALKIPTDLAGITNVSYEWPYSAEQTITMPGLREEYMRFLGSSCDKIRDAIRDLGISETKVNKQVNEIKSRQNVTESRIQEAEKQIEKLFAYAMSDNMYLNLQKVNTGKFGKFVSNGTLRRELRHLRDLGYIKSKGHIGDLPKEGAELSAFIEITPTGKQFVEFRESLSL